MWKSDDGGANFRPVRTPHGDNHALWINPEDPSNLIEGNDGGANISFDGGRSWSVQSNQPTSEFYRLTVDDQWPYWLYSGQQDNSAMAIPSRTSDGAIDRQALVSPAGCETATVAVDPRDPNITYGGCYGGSINRFDRRFGNQQQVMAWPQMAVGQQALDLRYRFQWNAPIRISPHDPSVLYHCSNVVHRTRDEGGNLGGRQPRSHSRRREQAGLRRRTHHPRQHRGRGLRHHLRLRRIATPGGPVVGRHRRWIGPFVARQRRHMEDITPAGMPEWGTVNSIELSAHDAGRAFIAVHRYRTGDSSPYIFRTDDFGATWTRLTDGSNGIPADHFVRVVREDPERQGLLFAGTEFGLYVLSRRRFELAVVPTQASGHTHHRPRRQTR